MVLVLPTTSVLKQREVPATVSSFYVSVLYTAMLRTSIAAVKSSLEAVSCQMQDQAKACSPTDQPVRQFKDSLGINMTTKFFFTFRTERYFDTRTAVQAWSTKTFFTFRTE